MAQKFSKRKAYNETIAALEELLKDAPAKDIVARFQGLGGLKELLLPIDSKEAWSASDLNYYDDVVKIHELLKRFYGPSYKEAFNSLKSSILTSFYTPEFIINPIVDNLKSLIDQVEEICEPSAGSGNFVKALRRNFPESPITAVEKDVLTSKVLRALHPEATVINKGYEEVRSKKFDLIVSNIPFGAINVYDADFFKEKNPVKIKSTTRIHNYFFVRSLDNLYDGGIVAFITSNGLMDSPGNKEIREFLVKKAHLISAVRLPNNTFESSGTYPVTDLIVLKKDSTKLVLTDRDRAFIETDKIGLQSGDEIKQVDISRFFTIHPESVLGTLIIGGQYGRDSLDVETEMSNEELSAKFNDLISSDFSNSKTLRISASLNKIGRASAVVKEDNTLIPLDYPDRESLIDGNLVILNQRVGRVTKKSDGPHFTPEPLGKDLERISSIIGLRRTYNKLLQAELSGFVPDMQKLRESLNTRYDEYVFRYGQLNESSNKKFMLLDSEGFKLLSLERSEEGVRQKADIFLKQINNVERSIERPESLKDAVLLSLNTYNKVNIDFISDLIGKNEEEILREGFKENLLFYDFEDTGNFKVVTKDEFLSGNILSKISHFENLDENYVGLSRENLDNHLNLLKEVKPPFLKLELLDVSLGERWVKHEVYEEFAEHLFKTKSSVNYMRSSDQYLIKVLGSSDENDITWAAKIYGGRFTGSQLLEYAMLDSTPSLTMPAPMDRDKRIPDTEGMKNCEMKIKEIKEEFDRFILNTEHVRLWIEEMYNGKFNNSIRRNYDGSHLSLKDLEYFNLHSHQKDAAWMLMQNDGGIVDHVVGAGKSLVIVTAAHEMKRLGVNRKPLGLFLKANIDQVVSEYKKAYPKDKVLFPTEKDFQPANRKALFASIAANDWDFVALTHEQYRSIPQSLEIQREIIQKELDNLEEDLSVLSEDKQLSKRLLKGLEKRKENLVARLKEVTDSLDRDEYVLDFDKMGFDHIFVDESHQFKNLHFTTRHSNVAGMGSPEGSMRAFNLEMGIRTIQKRKGGDKGVTFLSGTTISNSLVELYLLFKYIRPNELQSLEINGFDSWAKMFARKSSTYEFTVTNEIKRKDRFREFVKVPELARFYAEIAHVVTQEMLNVPRPRVVNEVLNIEPTETQEDFTKRLVMFAKTKDGTYVGLGKLSKEKESAYMLLATNLAKKMSLDMPLVDSQEYGYEAQGKLGHLITNVLKEYHSSNEYRGTQLIFSDIGTPNTENFSVYHEIKRLLVNHGIPENQIEFIHDHDTKAKRKALYNAVNEGEVRLLIGSTTKLGTGVNVQKRVVTMHHLDIPWRPSDYEQRIGRGGRQGNVMAALHRNNEVRNVVYAVNRSLDGYQFNILANKQKFINQIKNNSIDVRRIDEGSIDQDGGMNFGEYVALLSGNTDLLEKVKLEKQLADLERNYMAHISRVNDAEYQIKRLTSNVQRDTVTLGKYKTDYEVFKHLELNNCSIRFNGKLHEDRTVLGTLMLDYRKKILLDSSVQRGTMFEFSEVLGFKTFYSSGNGMVTHTPSGLAVNYADGLLNENPALAGRYLLNAMGRIPSLITLYESDIVDSKKKIETYEKELGRSFPDKETIMVLKNKVQELNERIEKAYNQTEKVEVAADL